MGHDIDEIISEPWRGVSPVVAGGLTGTSSSMGGIALDIDPRASGRAIVSCKNFSGQIFLVTISSIEP
jgi:hypothetical protein